MKLSEIEYPLRLCVEMLHFTAFLCEKTKDLRYSEIKKILLNFFDEDMILKAQDITTGKDTGAIINEPMNFLNKNISVGGKIII